MESAAEITEYFRDLYARKGASKIPLRKRLHQRVVLLKRYGMTPLDWDEMFEAQGRKCANTGCQAEDPNHIHGWHTDHCHRTGKVRGILCPGCNVALGQAQDSPSRLFGLILYLKKNNA